MLLVAVLMLQSLPLAHVLAPHEHHASPTEHTHKCGCTEGFCRCKHEHGHDHAADASTPIDGVRLVPCADQSQAVLIALPLLKAVAVQQRAVPDVPVRIRYAGSMPAAAPSPFPDDIFHPPRSQQAYS